MPELLAACRRTKLKFGFPTTATAATGGGGGFGAGFYHQSNTTATPPNPIQANWPNSTTKMTDNSVNDQSSYEGSGVQTNSTWYTHILYNAGASVSFNSYTASIYFYDSGGVTVRYWDGANWQTYDSGMALPQHFGTPGWENLNRNPVDRSAQFLCFSLTDSSVSTLETRVGDWRITAV